MFALAERRGCTPAQLALAWLIHRGDDVFPIPGSKSAARIEENIRAIDIKLTGEECREIEGSVPSVTGDRYPGYARRVEHSFRRLITAI